MHSSMISYNFKTIQMNNTPMYLIQKEDLQSTIRDVVASEFKLLEERLLKSSNVLTREQAADLIGVTANTISMDRMKDNVFNSKLSGAEHTLMLGHSRQVSKPLDARLPVGRSSHPY